MLHSTNVCPIVDNVTRDHKYDVWDMMLEEVDGRRKKSRGRKRIFFGIGDEELRRERADEDLI